MSEKDKCQEGGWNGVCPECGEVACAKFHPIRGQVATPSMELGCMGSPAAEFSEYLTLDDMKKYDGKPGGWLWDGNDRKQ